jgi:glycerophosphoryl diester phosphodiesterase
VQAEIDGLLRAGVDGFFTDQADIGRAAVTAWQHAGRPLS